MPSEIERKFLLDQLSPEVDRSPCTEIEQGYLAVSASAEVRVRRAGESHSLTVKRGSGEEREETEISLDPSRFEQLWEACGSTRLAKRRHLVDLGGELTAEVDVYGGDLAGLAVAEVEFPSREAAKSFQAPDWFGYEVTGDRRYANQSLASGGIPSDVSRSKGSRTYGLEKDESVGAGLTRIARGRAEKALERLRESSSDEDDRAEAVHGARKDMKKLRTALRLLRDELPKEVRREEDERYRQAARSLSAARDAEVKVETLDGLVEKAEELPEDAVESWRRILDRDREAAANTAADESVLSEATSSIEAGLEGIGRWQLQGEGWDAIEGSLRRVYRRGRRAMRDSEAEPTETNFHQWRKRAKDLRYGLELIEDAWSGPLGATADEAHRLTDLLGDHHDLAMLRSDLRERRLGEEATGKLEAAIDEQQEQLAAAALDLGRRLYAESPKDFSRRLGGYWEAWRG